MQRQLKTLVPGAYCLLTFTVPAEFRTLAFAHQQTLYGNLMQCAWQALLSFSRNDQPLQGMPGAIAVLHAHSGRLNYHPHVHCASPAPPPSAGVSFPLPVHGLPYRHRVDIEAAQSWRRPPSHRAPEQPRIIM